MKKIILLTLVFISCWQFCFFYTHAQVLYGTTFNGGNGGSGTINKFVPATNNLIVCKSFESFAANPDFTSFIQASNGKLYAMTASEGSNGVGAIFSFDPSSSTYSKLRDFDSINGGTPHGSLMQASNGKLYGMTSRGGSFGAGVIFSFDPSSSTFTKLKDFDGINGGNPYGSLMQASNGKLYGMTKGGGSMSAGIIFSFDPSTAIYTKLKDFGGSNGSNPEGSLIQAGDGKLYGMTVNGGTNNGGVIFSFNPSSSIYTRLKNFDKASGRYPHGSLVQASDGKLYGTTSEGGINGLVGYGVIFSFNPSSSAYAKLKDFDSVDGAYPYGSLMQASNGKLYGMTSDGNNGSGAIFSFDPSSSTYATVTSFDGTKGAYPHGSLMQANDGKLYGMTSQGGSNGFSGFGVIFSFDLSSSTYSKLRDFGINESGSHISGSLMQARDGKLYGMTLYGGSSGVGVLFSYDPFSSIYIKLKDFDGINGANPYGSLVQASDGKLYGMTANGGSNDGGVIFSFDPSSSTYLKVMEFDDHYSSAANPHGSLIQASDGQLYGMTFGGGTINGYGAIFSFNPSTSAFFEVYGFDDNDGGSPYGSLMQASDGKLYGMTTHGAVNSSGTLFSFAPYTNLNNFYQDGIHPYGNLIQASDGRLYGVTSEGGSSGYGDIFAYDPSSSDFANLKDFDNADGANSYGSLVQASDGKLYGMTYAGGSSGKGVIFSYDPSSSTYTKLKDYNGPNGANPYIGSAFIEIINNSGNLEAEEAVLHGAVVASDQAGYTGFGFADYVHASGDYIEWTANDSIAGSYSLTFRYANGALANRPLKLEVNGVVGSASLAFASTGSFATWSVSSATANLIAGVNKIRLTTIGSNGPNIDNLTIVKNTCPHSTILPTGTVNICSGSFVTLTANTDASVSYQWLKNGSPVSGATAQTLIVDTGGDYRVVEQATASGCRDTSAATTVNIPASSSAITPKGNLNICATGSVVLQANSGTGLSYQWKKDTSNITGATDIQYTATSAGAYYVRVTGSSGCSSTSAAAIVIDSCATGQPVTLEAEDAVLNGAVAASNQVGYTGSGFADYIHASGDFIEWTVSAPGADIYSLQFRYANSALANRPLKLEVNGVVVTASLAFVSTGSFANWSVSSATANLIAGVNKIRLTTTGSNGPNIDNLTLVKNICPHSTILPTGTVNICSGSLVTLTANADSSVSYQWLKNGSPVSGATTQTLIVNTGGDYRVIEQAIASGCRDTSAATTVNVLASPSATITPQDNVNICVTNSVVLQANSGAGLSYQWKKDTSNITGATDTQYTATSAGAYYVRVTGSNGCSSTSAATIVIDSCATGQPTTLEAEDAVLNGAVAASNQAGYSGSGFADYIHASGDFIEWTASAPGAGSYLLQFRYANGALANRPLKLEVNGVVITANQAFSPTGSWKEWSVSTATASLSAGINKIRLTTIGSNGPNVDILIVKKDTTCQSGTLEAEQALLNGALVASNKAGFTGSGFADYVNASGDFIEWTINALNAGSFSLQFRYANGVAANRPLKLEINGVIVSANLAFPTTGGWESWSVSTATANLIVGVNKIKLTTIGSNGPNIDNLAFSCNNSNPSVQQRSAPGKTLLSSPVNLLKAYAAPNPVEGSNARLVISASSHLPINLQLTDALGRSYKAIKFILSGANTFDFAITDLSPGAYTVILRQGNLTTHARLIIGRR